LDFGQISLAVQLLVDGVACTHGAITAQQVTQILNVFFDLRICQLNDHLSVIAENFFSGMRKKVVQPDENRVTA
jgi:hypothetical protein